MNDYIEIKMFANLRKLYRKEVRLPLPEPQSLRDILKRLTVPAESVAIIFVNGKHATPEDKVGAGDTVALFPPIAGG